METTRTSVKNDYLTRILILMVVYFLMVGSCDKFLLKQKDPNFTTKICIFQIHFQTRNGLVIILNDS